MNKLMSKILMMVVFGLLVVATASEADAQSRCRTRGGRYVSSNYNDNRYNNYNDNRYNDDYRYRDDRSRRRSRDDDYYEDQDTKGKALKRTGIGAGAGAGAGALIGGKKGAAIGAGIGAAAGYIYHRKKVNDQRDRSYRY